ncbi:hemagglutinin repeat-containing protein, partial [Campylobacter ureolyticus]
STTLTSAELKFKDGALNNIDVKQGEISISNRGLKDESNYLNIISKTAKISANVYANNLNIITGKNKLDKDLNILSSSSDDTKISIDTSNLGGMYANRIKLIATNKGIGVNNNAKIVANNDISINLNGDLINKADIVSNDNINIKAKDIENNGNNDKKAIVKSQTINLKADNLNNKNSIIQTNSKLTLKSNNLINKDSIIGKDDLNKNTHNNINNNNKNNTNNSQIVVKNTILNKNSKILSNELNLEINKDIDNKNSNLNISSINNKLDNIKNSNTNFIVENEVNLNLNNLLQNSSNFSSNNNLSIKADSDIINSHNSQISSFKNLNLIASNTIKNSNSKLVSNGDINLKSNYLYTDKLISSNKNLFIDSKKIDNLGDIKANDIAINSNFLNNELSIISYSNLDIKTNFLNNKNSLVYALNKAIIKSDEIINSSDEKNNKGIQAKNLKIDSTTLDNSNGNIISNGLLDIKIKDSLNNTLGYIGAYLDLNLDSSLLNNKDGFIISNKNLFINTDKYSNHGNLQARKNLSLITKDTIDYNGGFYANKDIFIKTTDDFINNTKLISNNNLIINANNITNKGTIHSLNDMSLNSYLNLNNFGEIASNKNLFINSNYLMNNKANIYSNKALIINSNDILNIDKSTLYSKDDMILNTNTLINKDSSNIISDKNLDIFYTKDKISNNSLDYNNLLKSNYDYLSYLSKLNSNENYKSLKIDNLSSLMYSRGDMSINAKELNNRSLDELKINKNPKIKKGSINLRDNNQKIIPFGVDIDKLKQDIIENYKINNNYKEPSSKYVENELKKEIINKNEKLYIISLHKNTKSNGKNIYNDIKFDFINNQAIITTSYIRDNEKTRKIDYTINKQTINEDDLAKFRPSSIISNKSINFLTNNLLNDKSIVFANKDINLKDTNLINKGLNLTHNIISRATYEWREKKRRRDKVRRKWVTKGGSLGTISKNYQEVGYPSIFAANGKITGSLAKLNNDKPNIADTIINKTPKFMKDDKDIFYKSLLKKDIYLNNITNPHKNNSFIISNNPPTFKDNFINPTNQKYYYLNNGYIYDENIPNSDYMHNKLTYIYDFRNSALKSILFKNNTPLNASSLIYAGDGISLDINGDLNNYSSIISNNYIKINVNNITNKFADIKANNELILNANNDILNLSSLIEAGSIYLQANNIFNQTLSNTNTLAHSYGKESFTNIADISTITSTKGDTVINAKDSIYLRGSNINSNKNIALLANNSILSKTVKDKGSYDFSMSGGYYKRDYEYSLGSNLNAKENILLKANKDITLISSNLNSNKDTILNSGNNINVLSSLESDYSETKSTSKGFMSKKTELIKSLQQEVKSSNIDGKNVLINSGKNITIAGSSIKANNAINLNSNNDINILSSKYSNFSKSYKSKSKFGGVSKSMSLDESANTLLKSSSLKSSDILLNSNFNILLSSATINADQSIFLNAKDSVFINSSKEITSKRSISKKSSFNPFNLALSISSLGVIDNPIYTQNIHKDLNSKDTQKASNLKANKDILINSNNDININGSNLIANKDISLTSKKGSVNILASKDSITNAVYDKKIEVSMISPFESFKNSINDIKNQETKAKTNLAKASYDEYDKQTNLSKTNSSNLISNQNIKINSFKDTNIIGSNLNAKENINLSSKHGDINILSSTNNLLEDIKKKNIEATLSLTAQNEYAQIGSAAKDLEEATKQLKSVKKEYDSYKKELNSLKDKLSNLKQRYKNKEAGIDYSDIEDLQDFINDLTDEEKYYKSNIALATENLASKSAALLSQTASAAASSGTYGFSVGVSADIKGNKFNSNLNDITNISSNLKANNINLNSYNDTTITGSNLLALNDITINSTNLNINSSQDTFTYKDKNKELSGSISFTIYGGGGGSLG